MNEHLVDIVKGGGVAVMPTDTLYGIVASALNRHAVSRVYEVRKRSPEKPCIILIADISDLREFGIWVWWWSSVRRALKKLWPGPVSVIFPCNLERFSYLHRNTNTLAFRLPNDNKLRRLLRQTGPLLAPSANPEGLAPATTISEAKAYFGDQVDCYEDAGPRISAPSTLVSIEHGKVVVLRQGAARLDP